MASADHRSGMFSLQIKEIFIFPPAWWNMVWSSLDPNLCLAWLLLHYCLILPRISSFFTKVILASLLTLISLDLTLVSRSCYYIKTAVISASCVPFPLLCLNLPPGLQEAASHACLDWQILSPSEMPSHCWLVADVNPCFAHCSSQTKMESLLFLRATWLGPIYIKIKVCV